VSACVCVMCVRVCLRVCVCVCVISTFVMHQRVQKRP
jgi:hypothetical protein